MGALLRDCVFHPRIKIIQELKKAIFDKAAAGNGGLRGHVNDNFQKRLQKWIDLNGEHLQNVVINKLKLFLKSNKSLFI